MNKSYLKWAGGKSRILQDVLNTFPANINIFAEPFTGSCTVALNVEANCKHLNDLNQDLVNAHGWAYTNPDYLIETLKALYAHGREDYYLIRDYFNGDKLTPVQRAATFIYLNKHGFNGMCRYNKSGGFNVPVGKGNSIHYPEQEILNFQANMDSTMGIHCLEFKEFCDTIANHSVVYCDPPYVPKSATLSDINYTGEPFTWNKHLQLKQCILELQTRGCHVVVSNHDLDITRDLYKDADEIRSVQAFRSISSKNNRGQVGELLAIYLPK